MMRQARLMHTTYRVLVASVTIGLVSSVASAQTFEVDVTPLVESSCLRCHGPRTATPLNLSELDFDLSDHDTFRAWEKVYTRVSLGEMPPAAAPQPDASVAETALESLKGALIEASLAARGGQRAPLRRLTRLEYEYTLQDLLDLDDALRLDLRQLIPSEPDTGGFDVVAAKQGISPFHVRSYLDAADRALDLALALGPRPETKRHTIDYAKSRYLWGISAGRALGIGIVKQLDDAFVNFGMGATYTFHSQANGFEVPVQGRYRVTVDAYPYQATTPVRLELHKGYRAGAAASLEELIGTFDLGGEGPRTVEVTPFLRPGDLISPTAADLDGPPAALVVPGDPHSGYGGMKDHPGEGIALRSMTFEGPLLDGDMWPPVGTRRLLQGVEFDETGEVRLTKAPYEHIVEIVEAFAPRAFRRPLTADELEAYTSLAKPILDEDRPFLEAVRVPLRAILSAPAFLYQAGSPGALDDYALASRLSYFLWRSMPDDQLFDLAAEGSLTNPTVLAAQVDRMLDDPKSARFVQDFGGQTFRLYEIKATTPDKGLYPEFDDPLAHALAQETQLFLTELIAENLGVGQLIDADFTFLNVRLAKHYGVLGVEGYEMRKVTLPADSPRGGLLTQASILKITANGTTTSPVPRGNFVLANVLGQPAPPPPPGVAGLEPDTRGTTTIREQLEAHRSNPVCGSCHRVIDPPGFALESFDPIGGFRTNYRASGGTQMFGDFEVPLPYKEGPAVDPRSVTPDGHAFAGIEEYKRILLEQQLDQVARHLTSQLVVFGTGAEIDFADRQVVEEILGNGRDDGFPIRTLIHDVAQSDLFRSR